MYRREIQRLDRLNHLAVYVHLFERGYCLTYGIRHIIRWSYKTVKNIVHHRNDEGRKEIEQYPESPCLPESDASPQIVPVTLVRTYPK